jgi:oxygen-independent coproporphyrinogen-3 oxidase
MQTPVESLYVHVPFCARKCGYCAFFSEVGSGDLIQRYTDALCRDMEGVAGRLHPATVFFGGGTPTILGMPHWKQIFKTMDRLGLLGAGEFTIECNPATVSEDKARLFRDHGVNRMSMGVQALDDSLLERLGRIHTRRQVFQSFDLLRRAGFDNLNIDLMFAIPGQTMEQWHATLDEALAMDSEHLSSYEVIYEEDTPLYEQLRAGKVEVNEDLACDMFEAFARRARESGFLQYEVANYARHKGDGPDDGIPSRACRHNINYWRGGDFFGLGPSATSYVHGVRTKNFADTKMCCDRIEQGGSPVESTEELAPLARAGEIAAFGLRMVVGWPFEDFQRVTGYDLRKEWSGDMQNLVERGWGRITPERFQLTPEGLRFADAAAEIFLR